MAKSEQRGLFESNNATWDFEPLAAIVPRHDRPNFVGLAACFEIAVATPVLAPAPSRVDLPGVFFPSSLTPFVWKGPPNKARDAR